jgi:hypothetical protein
LIYPDIRRDEDAGAYVLSVSSASTASLFQNQLIYPDIRRISIGIYEVPWGPFPGPTSRESTTAICELSEPSEKLQSHARLCQLNLEHFVTGCFASKVATPSICAISVSPALVSNCVYIFEIPMPNFGFCHRHLKVLKNSNLTPVFI